MKLGIISAGWSILHDYGVFGLWVYCFENILPLHEGDCFSKIYNECLRGILAAVPANIIRPFLFHVLRFSESLERGEINEVIQNYHKGNQLFQFPAIV